MADRNMIRRFPDLPLRMRGLPIDDRGFPVPRFVAWHDGKPDFRLVDPQYLMHCVRNKRCWICGEELGRFLCFVLGPMCVISRATSEPPNHRECAMFAAANCPFLANPLAKRPARPMPEGYTEPAGTFILRNPGVCAVYITNSYTLDDQRLINVGNPLQILWFAHGRRARREEIMSSIDSGIHHLEKEAHDNGPAAVNHLARQRAWFDLTMQTYS